MLRRQGALQSVDDLGVRNPAPLVAVVVVVVVVVSRMRCDGMDEACPIQGKSFEIIQFPAVAEDLKQSSSEFGTVDASVGADHDQTEGAALSSSTTRKCPSGNCWIADGSRMPVKGWKAGGLVCAMKSTVYPPASSPLHFLARICTVNQVASGS
ncbi:hypothetical protein [Variovorax paradoxus]|uniref:hypothetical protein n=1 Tax=Variovorax paradoxus TaxID=34073 RepID=UPI0018AD3800|nr:hypothetical protein [Variovorax paradoxus]